MRWETILWLINLNDVLIATRQWPQTGSFTGGNIPESFVLTASILLVYTGRPTLTVHIYLCIVGQCIHFCNTSISRNWWKFVINITGQKYIESHRKINNHQRPAIINRFQVHDSINHINKSGSVNIIEARIWKKSFKLCKANCSGVQVYHKSNFCTQNQWFQRHLTVCTAWIVADKQMDSL